MYELSFGHQAEVIDVAMVIARCGCNEITLEMLQEGEGYVSIKDGHTKVGDNVLQSFALSSAG